MGKMGALSPGSYLSNLPPIPTAPTQTDTPYLDGTGSAQVTRRSFWHQGYGYIFILEAGTLDEVYNSTSDGTNYTKPSTGNPVATSAEGFDDGSFDVLYDGISVYVIMANGAGKQARIKRGTMKGGVITWGSWVTVASAAASDTSLDHVSLSKTADGYFWVGYSVLNTGAGTWNIYCVKSANPNSVDSWSTPQVISALTTNYDRNCAVLPLSATSVYIVYYSKYPAGAPTTARLFGRTFDGSTVGSEEPISTMNIVGFAYSWSTWAAVSDGAYNICVAYQQNASPWTIWLRRRVAGTWDGQLATPITPSPSWWNSISLTGTNTTKIYIFYKEEVSEPYYNFYYRTWDTAGGFSSAVELATNEENSYIMQVCSNYRLQTGTFIGVWFRTNTPPLATRVVIVSGLS